MKKYFYSFLVFVPLALVAQSYLTVDPTSPAKGFSWFNGTSSREKAYDGTAVQTYAWLSDLTGGVFTFASIAGTGTATFAAQTAAGVGATATCAGAHVCDSFSGMVSLTTGTSPTSGSQLAITFPLPARTNRPNCAVSIYGGTTYPAMTYGVITTLITVSTSVALTASTAYIVVYVCGGN